MGLRKVLFALSVLLSVGVLVATWIGAGIVPFFIYYGLKILSPQYFLVTAGLLAAIVSVVTGTSWGTIGTLGIALMGISQGFGIPLPFTAGAIVSGAYFGDKLSPFSDTTNLAALAVEVNVYRHISYLLWTTLPAFLTALAYYYFINTGLQGLADNELINDSLIQDVTLTLQENFNFSPLLIIPPLFILGAAIIGFSPVPSMLGAALLAGGISLITGQQTLTGLLTTIIFGYQSQTGSPLVDTLLNRGGLLVMAKLGLLAGVIFLALQLILSHNSIKKYIAKLNDWGGPRNLLIPLAIAITLTIAATTGLSYLALLVPGQLLLPLFLKHKLDPRNLSRVLEDAGTAVVPLIPWGVAGIFISSNLGVATTAYLPYAVMCYTSVVFNIFYGLTGIGVKSQLPDKKT